MSVSSFLNKNQNLIIGIVHFLCFVYSITLLLKLWMKLDGRILRQNTVKYLSISSICGYGIASLFQSFQSFCQQFVVSTDDNNDGQDPKMSQMFSLIAFIIGDAGYLIWCFVQSLSYILCTYRVYITFKHSVYEEKSIIYCVVAVLISFYTIGVIMKAISIIFQQTNVLHKNAYKLNMYLNITIIIIDVLITTTMTYLFVSKIFQLIVSRKQSLIASHSQTFLSNTFSVNKVTNKYSFQRERDNTFSISLTDAIGGSEYNESYIKSVSKNSLFVIDKCMDEEQIVLIQTIVRYLILSIVAIFVTQICWYLALLVDIVYVFADTEYYWDVLIFYIWWGIDCIVNTSVIYLYFNFCHSTYLRLCRKCDNCCIRVCVIRVMEKLYESKGNDFIKEQPINE
eukprot:265491_1